MARPPKNYKKLYADSIGIIEDAQSNVELAIQKIDELDKKYAGLNKEFDKAVEINKQYQQTVFEQRGVIRYLELQVRTLDKKLTELENK